MYGAGQAFGFHAMISPADSTFRTARCRNVAVCPRAAAGDALPWYLGAGEYCPDCGEALAPADAGAVLDARVEPTLHSVAALPLTARPAITPLSAGAVRGDVRTPLTAVDRLRVPPTARGGGNVSPYAGFELSAKQSLRIVSSSPYRTGTL